MSWVVVGVGVASIGAGLYSSNKQSQAIKAASKDPNPWLTEASQKGLSRSEELSNRPYEAYEGARIAPLTTNQESAISKAATGYGRANDTLTSAERRIEGLGGRTFDADTARQYMNPYTEAALNPALREQKQAYLGQLSSIGGRAASMNAFGGDQSQMAKSRLERNYLTSVGDMKARGMADAFDRGRAGFESDQSREMQVASALRGVGGDFANLTSAQVSDLMRTGALQQMVNQMGIEANYRDYVEERDWEKNNLNDHMGNVSRARGGGDKPYYDDKFGNAIGTASAMIGMFGQMGAFNKASPSAGSNIDYVKVTAPSTLGGK